MSELATMATTTIVTQYRDALARWKADPIGPAECEATNLWRELLMRAFKIAEDDVRNIHGQEQRPAVVARTVVLGLSTFLSELIQ